jgi:Zn finger protein HypA/HybF involved in hydrogenase expression
MKVKCPKCGFEDEGNFCSWCGAPLPKPPAAKEEALVPKTPWTAKCPVCKSGQLELAAQKKFLT